MHVLVTILQNCLLFCIVPMGFSIQSSSSTRADWSVKFQTNVSSLLPITFADPNHVMMSVRQKEPHERDITYKWSSIGLNRYVDALSTSKCSMTPTVIAAEVADWAVMYPCLFGDITKPPRIVFLYHVKMMVHFINHILPHIENNFVLVSSGSDRTIPTGRGDSRFGPLYGFSSDKDGGPYWQLLMNHPKLLHWFCENHDLVHPKVSTLPIGVVEDHLGMEHIQIIRGPTMLQDIPLKFLVAHRTRKGSQQWDLRLQITQHCRDLEVQYGNTSLCVAAPAHIQSLNPRRGIPQELFIALASQVTFIVCVHGGGIDPSPKAWEAIMLGRIPIIHHNQLDDAYAQLPVLFVDNWNVLFDRNTSSVVARLAVVKELLSPYYSDPELRAMVVNVSKRRMYF